MTLTAIDLFCGCGGLSIGLKRAGFRVAAGFDNEPIAIESYIANRRHHGGQGLNADLFDFSGQQLLEAAGLEPDQLDLLAGCPPCQGFSSIATRRSLQETSDPRNALVDRFADLVLQMRPRAFMMENVPGLFGSERLSLALRRLRASGFRIASSVFDAKDFGVPQRRRRLIVMGLRGAFPSLARPKQTPNRTVKDAIGWLPKPEDSKDPLHNVPESRSDSVIQRIRATPKDGGSRLEAIGVEQLKCHTKSSGFRDVYGRMPWNDVAPTITGGCFNPSKGRFLHPDQDRAITIREAMLLQGFPKSATVAMKRGKTGAALMVGNAFPPALATAHAKELAKLLNRMLEGRK